MVLLNFTLHTSFISRSDPTLRGIVTLFSNFVKLEGVFASMELQNYWSSFVVKD